MTALVGRQVKRTFSRECDVWTGLPGRCTLKADRQDFTDFREEFGAGSTSELGFGSLLVSGHSPKLTDGSAMSRRQAFRSNTKEIGRNGS
jgi:hypothetical protein